MRLLDVLIAFWSLSVLLAFYGLWLLARPHKPPKPPKPGVPVRLVLSVKGKPYSLPILREEVKPMTGLTTDPNDPDLGHGSDSKPTPQQKKYLVLTDEELAKGFTRPFRTRYKHITCGAVTSMGEKLSATYARDPSFYGATYCTGCHMHRPVKEFTWDPDGETVGS